MKHLKTQKQLNEASENLNTSDVKESKTNGSVVDDTFKELDEKLSIINKETKDWLKQKILWPISEAYERGKVGKQFVLFSLTILRYIQF